VRFSADHIRRELDRVTTGFKELVIAGPAPAPLVRAQSYYRYQLMLRTPHMVPLGRKLAELVQAQVLPEDVILTVDVDPVDLS